MAGSRPATCVLPPPDFMPRLLWKSSVSGRVELKLVMAENVRAALVLVARREAPLRADHPQL